MHSGLIIENSQYVFIITNWYHEPRLVFILGVFFVNQRMGSTKFDIKKFIGKNDSVYGE